MPCVSDSDDWVTLREFIEKDQMSKALTWFVMRYSVYARTRRTVYITTRKHRARRKRRR